MKRKVWDITVKDNPNRVVMGENDEFYTTDTEAFLVFNLQDKFFMPQSAMITLENRSDGSLKSEEVEVVGGNITWEMPERYIEHFGNWQIQIVYETKESGQIEKYTSGVMSFNVNSHIGDKKQPSLVEIENWDSFMKHAEGLVEDWGQSINEMIFSGEAEIQKAKQDAEESALIAQQAMTDYLAMLGVDVATLGADGKLTADQIPALAINDTFPVNSKEEIADLIAQRGDVAILVHDENVSDAYILTEDEPSVLDNWIKLGVSYVAEAGHAETATNAVNSQRINGRRLVTLSQEQYDLGAKDPDTVYLVGGS